MKLHFQETPWDLYVVVAYAVAVTAVLVVLKNGTFISLFLILFVPGYVLMAALVPSNDGIGWTERVALSVVVSIMIVVLLAWALDFTPWGIGFLPIVVIVSLFTVGVTVVAVTLVMPAWWDQSPLNKGLILALVTSIMFATATLAYVAFDPLPGERFTEFYILGSANNASGYVTSLNVSQLGSVILGIANHESAGVNYTVRVDFVGLRIVHNATSGLNDTLELNRTTRSTFRVALADGQNWTQPYSFRINDVGLWKVQFLLFKNEDLSAAYREVHLLVRVRP